MVVVLILSFSEFCDLLAVAELKDMYHSQVGFVKLMRWTFKHLQILSALGLYLDGT